jgi:HD-GYP domain-containing protein (c-di-GMP phosphodiesterase class II)
MKDAYIYRISIGQLVECLSTAIELVNPVVAGHNKRVAVLSREIGRAMGLSEDVLQEIYLAGLLHDIGAAPLTIQEKEQLIQFDVENPYKHCLVGYLLLRNYKPFRKIAKIILYHHEYWQHGTNMGYIGEPIPIASYIIHLADRVDVLVKQNQHILLQRGNIIDHIAEKIGSVFAPPAVEAFRSLQDKESFWLSTSFNQLFSEHEYINTDKRTMSIKEIEDFTKLVSLVIDFKSRFTASHSRGVSDVAKLLGYMMNYGEHKCSELSIAGNLHDIGKLIVPNEILEKNGKLDDKELAYIRSHSYYTNMILSQVRQMKDIAEYASQHHEKIDGSGYPYHVGEGELSAESRLMAVADVYTALAEDRPYRIGMDSTDVKDILQKMADMRHLDGGIVKLLISNYGILDASRKAEQAKAVKEYRAFSEHLDSMLSGDRCDLHDNLQN